MFDKFNFIFAVFSKSFILCSLMDPLDKKSNRSRKTKGGRQSSGNFWRNLITILLVFLLISSLYSVIVENQSTDPAIPISELATDLNAGKVAKISVHGDDLDIEYATSTANLTVLKKTSK